MEAVKEKRIYVVVAETVDTPNGVVIQPCGRIAAQVGHSVSKMRLFEYANFSDRWKAEVFQFVPITTIVLAARDSKEMGHILHLLNEGTDTLYSEFYDSNEGVYGPGKVLTAICTVPIESWRLAGITDYLPLWSHGRTI